MKNLADRWLDAVNARLKPKPRPAKEGPHYADFTSRVLAIALDFVPILLVLEPVSIWAMEMIYGHFGVTPLMYRGMPKDAQAITALLWEARYPFILHNLFNVLLAGVPYLCCQLYFGNTPGKWLLGLRIVRHKTFEKPSRWRFILRFGAAMISLCSMVGFFCLSFNRERRALHDYIAGTVVINERPAEWYWSKTKLLFKRLYAIAVKKPMSKPPTE